MRLFATLFILSLCWAMGELYGTVCLNNFKSCSRDMECCSGCCFKNRCVPYSEGCNKNENPCNSHQCPPGKMCYLQQVQCFRAPCPPIPVCKPFDPYYY